MIDIHCKGYLNPMCMIYVAFLELLDHRKIIPINNNKLGHK